MVKHVAPAVDDIERDLPDKSVQPHRVRLYVDNLIAPASHDRDGHGKFSVAHAEAASSRYHERGIAGCRSDLQ